MTCFWDAILSTLDKNDYPLLGVPKNRRITKQQFITILKSKSKIDFLNNITWNGEKFSNKEQLEHREAIQTYNIKGIGNGHDTSSCDSFLLLLSHLLRVKIEHYYMNHKIIYSFQTPRKIIRFGSNRGHFYRK